MGRDKAALPLGDSTFLGRLVAEYSPAFDVWVSLGTPGQFPHPGAGEAVDRRPGQGPLAGLEAGFLDSGAKTLFLTATDLPLGRRELALGLMERLGDHDACVIRRRDGKIEPAFACYRRSCLPVLRSLLDRGRRSMAGLLEQLDVCYVPEETLEAWNLDRILKNVNTPEDLAELTGEML